MSNGAGSIGNRSGQQVNLRFYADLSGVYDTGLQPYATDSKGNLINVGGLYGVQLDMGAYGTHDWRQSRLGLDYTGNFYHYANGSQYDGSTQNLLLGYTYQKSRHLTFDFRQLVGLSSLGFGAPTPVEASSNFVGQQTVSLFDNRYYYLQSSMDMNYIASARTVYSAGGDFYKVGRQGPGLADMSGYTLRGTITHRISRTKTIGVTYQHLHMGFAPAFGQSDINLGEGIFSAQLGREWTFALRAGAYQADISGIQQVTLNPVLAALLGQSTGTAAFYRQDVYPSGSAALKARLKNSSFGVEIDDEISPGNGVYLTSRMESAILNYSYTGIHKWSFGVYGGYFRLNAIGQNLQNYSTWDGGASATYSMTKSLHIVARFDARDQQINIVGYKNQGYRSTLGIAWSPGDVPLSLW